MENEFYSMGRNKRHTNAKGLEVWVIECAECASDLGYSLDFPGWHIWCENCIDNIDPDD